MSAPKMYELRAIKNLGSTIARWWYNVAPIIPPSECWLWLGDRTAPVPYGRLRITINGHKETITAHRFSYLFFNGSLPEPPLIVRHLCGNTLCVNPGHLASGTMQENMDDREAMGRTARGDRHSSRTHPELLCRGKRNGRSTKPERTARGESHGSRTHPEKVLRGENHPYWGRKGMTKKMLETLQREPERRAHGMRHGKVVLDDEKVLKIRELRTQGMTIKAIGELLGIAPSTVQLVTSGKTWKHLLIPADPS